MSLLIPFFFLDHSEGISTRVVAKQEKFLLLIFQVTSQGLNSVMNHYFASTSACFFQTTIHGMLLRFTGKLNKGFGRKNRVTAAAIPQTA